MSMRGFVKAVALGAVAAVMSAAAAVAQQYPSQPITMIVPFPPGASTDAAARVLQAAMSERLGQPIVVENRPGAGGVVGMGQVARTDPDGYTIVLTVNAPFVMAPHLQQDLPYDPTTDFRAIGLFAETYLVLAVNAASDYQDLDDIIGAARERPGELTFGSAGIGSAHQIAGEVLNKLADIDIVHVPFQGGGPAVQDLLGGHIDMTYGTIAAIAPFVESGQLRMIGVVEAERAPGYPDTPALNETVPGVETSTWIGLFAPAGTPDEAIERLNEALVASLEDPAVVQTFAGIGMSPLVTTPAEAEEIVARDIVSWGEAISMAGIQQQ
jgi:tripartite-type tricarboxylate transporter receptor subunit TctC